MGREELSAFCSFSPFLAYEDYLLFPPPSRTRPASYFFGAAAPGWHLGMYVRVLHSLVWACTPTQVTAGSLTLTARFSHSRNPAPPNPAPPQGTGMLPSPPEQPVLAFGGHREFSCIPFQGEAGSGRGCGVPTLSLVPCCTPQVTQSRTPQKHLGSVEGLGILWKACFCLPFLSNSTVFFLSLFFFASTMTYWELPAVGVGSSFYFSQVGNSYLSGLWCQGRRSRGALSSTPTSDASSGPAKPPLPNSPRA